MKKFIITITAAFAGLGLFAQTNDALKAAAEAAMAMTEAPEEVQKVEKPSNWKSSLKTNMKFGETSLTNWAAGGDNTVTLQAFVDGKADYKMNELFWNNRLQLDYGFVYASSKPILQKSDDRIYLESKWGYKLPERKNLSFSINYDFKSQFTTGYDYLTPSVPSDKPEGTALDDIERGELKQLWKDARSVKSGFLAPAYTNLAVGIDVKPFNWLSLNIAPVTGGVVIVRDAQLRKKYGMELRDPYKNAADLDPAEKEQFDADMASGDNDLIGQYYRSARFEFGAQVKADIAVNINDNFAYTSQLVLFSNYLDKPENLRVNWDNRFDWKLAKYFSLTLTTNLIYDDKVMIFSEKDGETRQRVQFKESLLFGFTYTIANKN